MLEGNLHLRQGQFELRSGPFAVPAQGISVLFGKSGCGKSTLLRAIAGLERATRGTLRFKGELWQDGRWHLPTPQRDIGFVFQDAALFPHLTVRANLAFAAQRVPAAQPGDTLNKIAACADRVGISGLLEQSVTTLSGGQRQRVAFGRALLAQPRLLCLDEPLSALDWQARGELLTLIDRLVRETGLPTLFITHAPQEVQRLADRVIFMEDGRIERIQTLHEALARPDSPLFAEEGPVSVLHGSLSAADGDGLRHFGNAQLRLRLSLPDDTDLSATRLRVLARDVSLASAQPQGLSILNQLPATILALHEHGHERITVVCQLADGQQLLAEITRFSCRTLNLRIGQQVFALVKSVALMG